MSRGCRPGSGRFGATGPAARGSARLDERRDDGPEDGMVTAELAVALPALMLAGLLAVSGLQIAAAQLRCLDAAGIAARLAARGEVTGDIDAATAAAAPRDAQVTLGRAGNVVSAEVVAPVHLLGLGGLLPAFRVTASAAEPLEPGPPS